MSQLARDVKDAVLDAVAKVPGAALTANWRGLSAAVRARIYADVAERLFQRDNGTVSASLLDALRDLSVGDAWKQVLLAWATDRVKDSDKLQLLAGGLEDGRLSREEVVAAVAAWARTQVDDEVALSLLEILENGQLSEGDLKSALLAAAAELAGDSEAAEALRAALADGRLGRNEAISVLLAWGRRQIRNETLLGLFQAMEEILRAGSDRPKAQEIVARVLETSGLDAALVRDVLGAVENGKVDPAELLLVLSTWSVAASGRDLAEVAGRLRAGDPLGSAAILLQGGLPNGASALLQKLVADDWLGVLSAVLGTLELGLGGRLLRTLAGGSFRDLAVRKLTGLLERADLDQAGTVANAILDIVSGARSLFAAGEEAETGLTTEELAFWSEIRQVLFMARLDVFGGTIVSTSPQAQPHIFSAGAIRINTPLHDLLPSTADDGAKQRFCERVTEFLDVRFGSRMRRRFRDEPVLAIALTDLKPNGSTGEILFIKVERRLLPGA